MGNRFPDGWPLGLHHACTAVAWCAALNALVITFTLAGGVVLGLGPALVTAAELSRRHHRGEAVRPIRDFAAAWRREFVRANAVFLPVIVVAAVLWSNYGVLSAIRPDGTNGGWLRLATLAALLATVAIGSVLAPMYAHYALPVHRYLPTASRFVLAWPASTIVLLFTFAAFASVTAVFPVLAVAISLGAWMHTSTWLCLRFFAENDDRVAERALPEENREPRLLPAEPLRMR